MSGRGGGRVSDRSNGEFAKCWYTAHRAVEMALGPLILTTSVSVVSHGLVGRFGRREHPVRSLCAALQVARGFGTVSAGEAACRPDSWTVLLRLVGSLRFGLPVGTVLPLCSVGA